MHLYYLIFIIFITYRYRFGSFVWESLAVTSSPRFREGDPTIICGSMLWGSPECEFGRVWLIAGATFLKVRFGLCRAAQEN